MELKNQPVKVAIVVCAWPPQGGGIGNNAYYHAKYLPRLGYRVSAFTPAFAKIKKVHQAGIWLEYVPVWLPLGKAGFLFPLLKKLKDFDLIHLYYPFFGTDLIVWWFKFWHREKKLVIHYEMDPVGQGGKRFLFWLYLKLFLGPLVRISDRVAVLSWDNAKGSYLKKYLKKYPAKFVEIPNGIDIDIFRPKPKYVALKDGIGIRPGEKVVAFAGGLGRLHFFKGVEVLIKAVASLKNKKVKLLIIGDGEMREHYEQLAKNLGLAEQVIFTGWVANDSLADYYNLADIFVLPSTARTESFGIVVAEAQACGVPAIVANWPGVRATIEDGKTGFLVEPKNEIDLAQKIRGLLAEKEIRKAMSEAGRERAVRLYDWNKVLVKLDQVYQELLTQK